MRHWWASLRMLPVAMAILAFGIWADEMEAALYSLLSMAAGIVWDLIRARQTGDADPAPNLRLSRRKLLILAYGLAVFAAATVWGIYQGSIPAELVMIMLGFVAAAPILALPYLIFYRLALAKARSAESWPSAKGKVVNAWMDQVGSAWPAPIVIYAYEVDDRAYRSSRVRLGGTGMMSPLDAEQILERFPTGAEVDVFHDPKRPGQSVLIPKQDAPSRNLLWGAALSAGAALLGAGLMALMVVLGLVDAVLTAVVGHRVLP